MVTFLSRANKGPLSQDALREVYRTIVETTKSEAHAARRRLSRRRLAAAPGARHPLSTPSGRRRATLRERPTASTTPTTSATSL